MSCIIGDLRDFITIPMHFQHFPERGSWVYANANIREMEKAREQERHKERKSLYI